MPAGSLRLSLQQADGRETGSKPIRIYSLPRPSANERASERTNERANELSFIYAVSIASLPPPSDLQFMPCSLSCLLSLLPLVPMQPLKQASSAFLLYHSRYSACLLACLLASHEVFLLPLSPERSASPSLHTRRQTHTNLESSKRDTRTAKQPFLLLDSLNREQLARCSPG